MRIPRSYALIIAFAAVISAARAQSPFAALVLRYDPAPGQFVQNADFNDVSKALGPPRGGSPSTPDNTSTVSLGAFGGSITLGFDHTVMDSPLNPLGLDAIVFGNGFYVGSNEQRRWAEAGTIEISRDVNSNGLADDPWYLIPGSHIDVLNSNFLIVTWDANIADATYPPALASWLPPGANGVWETGNYELPPDLFGNFVVENPSTKHDVEGVYGYADLSPTLALGDLTGDGVVDDASLTSEYFYTVPDDPLTVGIDSGSGGGDAFDIAWAVDQDTGDPAKLDGFDFIRITSAVAVLAGILGEVSTEVDAVSDVTSDSFGDTDGDSDIDLQDVTRLTACFDPASTAGPRCIALDRDGNDVIDSLDTLIVLGRVTGPGGDAR